MFEKGKWLIAGWICVLLITGCTTATISSTMPPSPTVAAEIVDTSISDSPSTPSPSPRNLLQLESTIDKLANEIIDQASLVGLTIGIKYSDQAPNIFVFGYAIRESQIATQPETIYMLGSVTKQFTAVGIMRLYDQGELGLDDLISQYLPDIPQSWEGVTIRQLLNHTGGIPNYATDSMGFDIGAAHTPEELMDQYTQWNLLNFAPGSRWEYSNRGYFLLGMIIKQITGQNYYDYLKVEILEPLGMNHTQACIEVSQNLAKGYRIASLGGEPEIVETVNPSFAYGAGDLCSTAGDLLEWQKALASGRVVSEDAYSMMISPAVLPDGTPTGYGFGLEITEKDGRKAISHAGGIPSGFITLLTYYPDKNYGIVLLTNTMIPAYNPLTRLESNLIKELVAAP